jgi:hypothetical protein
MAIRNYSVTIRKTVQVKQYEPVMVELTSGGDCYESELMAERKRTYEELKAEMKAIFGPTTDRMKCNALD